MNWSKLLILLIIAGCQPRQSNEASAIHSKFVLEAKELATIINHDSIVIVDIRKPIHYSEQHLPKAINIWRTEIENNKYPFSGMMADETYLENVLGEKGISSDQFLVLYDDRQGCEAARLWWVLNYYGHKRMAILNGGLKAWKEVGTLTSVQDQHLPRTFTFPEVVNHNSLARLEDISNSYTELSLVDTRSKEEFSGVILKNGASDKGRIPGSIHLDWMNAVDAQSGKFKSIDDLKLIYAEVLNSTKPIVTYCHSGVRSAHTYFVLTELLGLSNVRNFDGSWVEWSYHQLSIESDSVTIL